ncbi:hypothetical protein APX81_23450 [Escherichia coli]|nr:hypothetical protein [Escherichia coli]EAC1404675.1 hypothetical protein [Escherichia coli]EFN9261495.1 hypothetical protein [Escherichia coli]MCT6058269.1 hypothetical protein [Escherichia coli]PAZ26137.1 hypothetical protein APU33_08380 [Escherichia coli]PAZ31420.1 hypothetical protein APU34_07270 [Escherichia coli]
MKGLPVRRQPLFLADLCGHEQPVCQEGRLPKGTGMKVRLRRPFFSPAFSVYGLSDITSPSL